MLEKEKHSNDDHCIFLFMTGWVLWQNKALGITECKPDIIAITGDFIDCRNPNVDIAMKFILGAVDIAPVYYVPGNHECWEKEAYTELCRRMENAGVHLIANASEKIFYGTGSIQCMGLEDPDFYDAIGEENENQMVGYHIQQLNALETVSFHCGSITRRKL